MHAEIQFKQKPTASTLELVRKLVPEGPLNEALLKGSSTEKHQTLGVRFENLRLFAGGLLRELRTQEDAKEIIKTCRQICQAEDVDSLYYVLDLHSEDSTLHQYRVLFETPGAGTYPDLVLEQALSENFEKIECEEKATIRGKPLYIFHIRTGPVIKSDNENFKEYTCSLASGTKTYDAKFEVLYYGNTLLGVSYGHPCSPLNFKIIRPTINEAMQDFEKEFARRGLRLVCEKIDLGAKNE
jgi:hypothetical protein